MHSPDSPDRQRTATRASFDEVLRRAAEDLADQMPKEDIVRDMRRFKSKAEALMTTVAPTVVSLLTTSLVDLVHDLMDGTGDQDSDLEAVVTDAVLREVEKASVRNNPMVEWDRASVRVATMVHRTALQVQFERKKSGLPVRTPNTKYDIS